MIDVIVKRLRTVAGVFGDRVWGAPNLDAMYSQPLPAVPSAFVLFMGDQAAGNLGDAHVLQEVTQSIGIVAVLDNQPGTPGQTPIETELGLPPLNQVLNAREALWYSLLGWSPDLRSDPLVYAGSTNLKSDATSLWHLFLFERARQLSDMAAFQTPDGEEPVPFLEFAPDYRIPTSGTPLPVAPLLASDLIQVPQE